MTGDRSGYTLHVDPAAVDAPKVLRTAETMTALLGAGEAASALEADTRALAGFRGDALLPDAGDGDWLAPPTRVQLEEVRRSLVEPPVGTAVARRGGEIVGEHKALVDTHPLRERGWELPVAALYRAGRQPEALAAHQRVRPHCASTSV